MDKTHNHPLRVARKLRNLSILEVAEATFLSERTIRRAENGHEIRPASRRILCDFYESNSQKLGIVSFTEETQQILQTLPQPVLATVGGQESEFALPQQKLLANLGDYAMANHQDPSRRALLQQLLGLVSLATFPPLPQSLFSSEPKERLERALQEPAAIDDITISHYEQLTALGWHLSDEDGLGLIEQILPTYLPHVAVLAQRASKYQKRLASIAAQSCLLGYVITLHREDFHRALSYCQQARFYGQLAKDVNLEVVALLRMGNVYLYLRSPWKSLDAYQEALPYIESMSPLVRARLHAVMAEVQGKLGGETDVQNAIGSAYDSFPTSTEGDPAARYIHFSQSGLYLHEGLAYLNLHQGKVAAKALEQVDGLHPKLAISERSRIDILVQQSWAASQLHDLDQFAVYIKAAVRSAQKLGSDLMLSEAWNCCDRQPQWTNEPAFRRLGELFRPQGS